MWICDRFSRDPSEFPRKFMFTELERFWVLSKILVLENTFYF